MVLAGAIVAPLLAALGVGACSSDSPGAAPLDAAAEAADVLAGDAGDVGDAESRESAADARPADAGGLGAACTTDLGCATGLSCWTYVSELDFIPPQFPSGGMCTTICGNDSTCAPLAANAQCDPTLKVCVEACVPGGGDGGFDRAKCQGRHDMACNLASPPECAPTCNANEDCPTNSSCAGATGMCRVGAPPTNLSAVIGRAADGGVCGTAIQLKVFRPTGGGFLFYCSALCTLGAPYGCGWDGGAFPASTYCLPIPGHPDTTTGDLGECARLCDCDTDCVYPLVCAAMSAEDAAKTGHRGACVDKIRDPDASTLACLPDAGAD
jgi:hypothetical protein